MYAFVTCLAPVVHKLPPSNRKWKNVCMDATLSNVICTEISL